MTRLNFCKKCGESHPVTTDFYYRDTRGQYGDESGLNLLGLCKPEERRARARAKARRDAGAIPVRRSPRTASPATPAALPVEIADPELASYAAEREASARDAEIAALRARIAELSPA